MFTDAEERIAASYRQPQKVKKTGLFGKTKKEEKNEN